MQGVKFRKSDHKYFNRITDEEYISVTTFIGLFKNKFDAGFWSTYKAIQYYIGIPDSRKDEFSGMLRKEYGHDWKNPKMNILFKFCSDRGLDLNVILKDKHNILYLWKEYCEGALDKGTKYHDKKEKESYDSKGDILGDANKLVEIAWDYSFDLKELSDGFRPEVLVYNHDLCMSGQLDKLFIETIEGKRYFDIDDYKTNHIIKTTGLRQMLDPISDIDDCNFIHYSLQINIYAWMLEQFGFIRRNLMFSHHEVGDNGELLSTPTTYKVPDLRPQLSRMFDTRRSYLRKQYVKRF